MHGRVLRLLGLFLLAGPAGCSDARPEALTSKEGTSPTGSTGTFDQTATGAIEGRVVWDGPVPVVSPIRLETHRFSGREAPSTWFREPPNVPEIDPESRGVHQAVVFLREIPANTSVRPWPYPPVRIEQADLRLRVLQGGEPVRTGFVRRGDEISMAAADKFFYSLHGSGADYFTYTCVEPNQSRRRIMRRPSVVELSSAAGHYWMRAYLFVADHPYYARTNRTGSFRLDGVPPGTYRVVCWLPNWDIARSDWDPEACLITRMAMGAPLETEQQVVIDAQRTSEVHFSVSAAEFRQLSGTP